MCVRVCVCVCVCVCVYIHIYKPAGKTNAEDVSLKPISLSSSLSLYTHKNTRMKELKLFQCFS
jgi:hypothetical protein